MTKTIQFGRLTDSAQDRALGSVWFMARLLTISASK
jgi:hypothetical protein